MTSSSSIAKKRRLGVAFLEADEEDYLRKNAGGASFDLALREDLSATLSSGALLLFGRGGALRFAARVTRRRRVDDLRTSMMFEELVDTEPMPIEQFRAALLSTQQAPTSPPGGTLTDKAAERVAELLERYDPAVANAVARWRSHAAARPPGAAPTIYEQRDATVTLFRIAGMRSLLTDTKDPAWHVKQMQRTYLPGTPLEDPAIVADACSFLGWKKEDVDGWGASAFSDGAGSLLTVANINRHGSETATGADLVYYHVQRGSFVHVQYKRMKRVSDESPGQTWAYDEDRHIAKQMSSLQALDQGLATNTSLEYRLSPETGYFKFTKMDDYSQGDAALVPGQYMSAGLLDLTRRSRGGKLGRLRTDAGLPYLTNTLFAELVGYGLIGSRGADHKDVAELIAGLAEGKESVVIGIHSEEKPTRRVRDLDARPLDDGVDLGPLTSGP